MARIPQRSFLVTGAGGALGSRITALLAARGALLTVTGRDPARLPGPGDLPGAGAVHQVPADLGVPGAPQRLVAAAVAAHGGLDGIVHAAGVVAFGPLDDLDDDVLDELLLVTLVAPVRLLRAGLPALRASAAAGRGPVACFVSAVVAERALPGMAAYSAAKAGLTAFDRAMAVELRRAGIRVVDVRPPHTETGLAGRPIAGTAPALPPGLDPDRVAARIVAAIEGDEREVASTDF